MYWMLCRDVARLRLLKAFEASNSTIPSQSELCYTALRAQPYTLHSALLITVEDRGGSRVVLAGESFCDDNPEGQGLAEGCIFYDIKLF